MFFLIKYHTILSFVKMTCFLNYLCTPTLREKLNWGQSKPYRSDAGITISRHVRKHGKELIQILVIF